MKLENVQFVQGTLTPKRIAALFVLSVGVPYAWKRVFRYISSSRWTASSVSADASAVDSSGDDGEARRTRVLTAMKRVETFVIACQLLNLLAFLRKGTYRSLPERCLALKMVRVCAVAYVRRWTGRECGGLWLTRLRMGMHTGEHCAIDDAARDQL